LITYERVDGFNPNLIHRFLFSFSGMSSKMYIINRMYGTKEKVPRSNTKPLAVLKNMFSDL